MKRIIITEGQYKYIVQTEKNKKLLLEMPYSPQEYSTDCSTHAIIAYIHLAKLFIFGNSTNNANVWLNHTVDNHILPLLTAKCTVKKGSKLKMFKNGFIKRHFGLNFEHYESDMTEFCKSAVEEVQSASKDLYHKDTPLIFSIEDAVRLGKEIIQELLVLCENEIKNNAISARTTIKPFIKQKLKEIFKYEI